MNPLIGVTLGWASFAGLKLSRNDLINSKTGSHMYMSHPTNRKKLIEKFGNENNFKGFYSLVSLITLGKLHRFKT